MKSISEIARELKITPQAVYKKVNNQLKTKLKNHIHKDASGKTLIDEDGQAIIKLSVLRSSQPVENQSSQSVVNQIEQENELFNLLKEQLKIKDGQIQELLNQNGHLIQKIENMQVLLKNEQEKNTPLIAEDRINQAPKSKVSFWKKFISD